MSDHAKIDLCILWESELRTAARLLEEAFALAATDDDAAQPEKEARNARAQKYMQAVLACRAALVGLTPERLVVILGGDGIRSKEEQVSAPAPDTGKTKT